MWDKQPFPSEPEWSGHRRGNLGGGDILDPDASGQTVCRQICSKRHREVLALSSHKEAFGIVAMETFVSGLPVVLFTAYRSIGFLPVSELVIKVQRQAMACGRAVVAENHLGTMDCTA